MIVLVILTEVIAFAAAEEHVTCRETQMIVVFVLTEDFHAGIIVVGEVLDVYKRQQLRKLKWQWH